MTDEQLAELNLPIAQGPNAIWTLAEHKKILFAEVQRLQSLLEDTRARQAERLKAAEDVCVMYGWTGDGNGHRPRGKALFELWSRWHDIVGLAFLTPAAHPDLSDEEIIRLAAQRDETRNRALAKFRGEASC